MTKEEINNLSATDLFSMEQTIQDESNAIVERLDIINILSKYGKPSYVGAKLLGVMTNKDIDVHCYVDNLTIDTWIEFIADVLRSKYIRRADVINYYDFDRSNNYLEDEKGFGYFISLNKLNLEGLSYSKEWNTEITLVPLDAVDMSKELFFGRFLSTQ